MDASPVKRLYKYYGLLAEAAEQGDKILVHEDLFNHIINARHGNSEEKRLSAQFIPKFSQYFPHLLNAAVSAQLDLCEDSELVVRKQAVKEVTSLCRTNPSCTKRVAYFIAQLLGAEDVGEGLLVRNTLVALFNVEPAATLGGITAQIRDGNPKMQERCKTFLINRFGSLSKSIISKMKPTLLNEVEICLENANSKEIPSIMPLVTYAAEDDKVDKVTVRILETQLNLEKDHLTSDEEDMKRIYLFTKFAKPHFLKGVNSGHFVNFYSVSVLPLIKEVEGYGSGTGQASAMLKQLSEIVPSCSDLPDVENCYSNLFGALQDLLPQEPDIEEDSEEAKKELKIHFTLIECLLATLLELITKIPPSYENYESCMEELKKSLKVLIRFVEPYRKRVSELDKSAVDRHLRSTSLRCLDNLKSLTRQFFFDPPKPASIVHSWYQTEIVTKKRRNSNPPPVEHAKKPDYHKARGVQQIYTPPGGKYSRSFKRF